MSESPRRLYLIFGDQLDPASPVLKEADRARDVLWMAETAEEASYVPAHRRRLVLFFSAMRHYRDALRADGWTVAYHALTADGREDSGRDFGAVLAADLRRLQPGEIRAVEAGDFRVTRCVEAAAGKLDDTIQWLEDTHFLLPRPDFEAWADGRRQFLLETFYRMMRKRTGILMDGKQPVGGEWNLDADNRESFGRDGPPDPLPTVPTFAPDKTTREVIELVAARFGDHPGTFEDFNLPVTRDDARAVLRDFVAHRLPLFGTYEDALWEGARTLYHSRLSAVLNLKLIHPREAIEAVLEAHAAGDAPLNSVEGFVRQVLGWREFVRGIYFFFGADYLDRNALEAEAELPSFFWDGRTEMACVRDAMANVLENGYAHHIQRLMILGQIALLYGVQPRRFHDWHMAMYLDAIDWVSAPNTIGMSQYGDGGIVGTKPYCASGNYIRKMSNHCAGCRFRPEQATGPDACPFTTFYYDFLDRHETRFADNRRMTFQLRNLARKSTDERAAIRKQAARWRKAWSG